MRVGAFARSLLLRGECSVDLVLMCTGKSIFSTLFIAQGRHCFRKTYSELFH